MNSKQTKTLEAIYTEPAPHLQIKWTDVKSLIKAVGGELVEGKGSRVKIVLSSGAAAIHKPHPHKELKSYQVELVRDYLKSQGVEP